METYTRQRERRDDFKMFCQQIRERDLKPVKANGVQVGWSGPSRQERRKEARARQVGLWRGWHT